jgi:hypothetical protein
VSYALDLSAEVRQVFATLSFQLQEAVLDELDRIAALPPDPNVGARDAAGQVVTDIGTTRHYVFFLYARRMSARTVVVKKIGYVTNTLNEPLK